MIATPLGKGVEIANQLANGNLLVAIPQTGSDEIGQLLSAMQRMVEKFKEMVTKVKDAADTVTIESRNLRTSVEAMSQGASQQAAAAQETSASMEEMTANMRQNVENAKIAEQIALKSEEDARQGGLAVTKTIAAMRTIEERTTIIQQIALQTHLLSMNATIEAAKAEDYGKGFAVVAAEVRSLAKHSQETADEIETLIKSSVTISAEAGQFLEQLMPGSHKTAELVKEISAASAEQLSGAEHINVAVQQLDTVIQQNAANAEQLAASAERLSMQADTLQQLIAFFTLTERREETPEKQQMLLNALQSFLMAFDVDAQSVADLLKVIHHSPVKIPHESKKVNAENPDGVLRASEQQWQTVEIKKDDYDEEFERF